MASKENGTLLLCGFLLSAVDGRVSSDAGFRAVAACAPRKDEVFSWTAPGYSLWFGRHLRSEPELAEQRHRASRLAYRPCFSIVVPLYRTPLDFLGVMFVVDNGRTLDAEGLSDDLITVIPNENVGGAGGFARGMIAALESDEDFTHVLLMDDRLFRQDGPSGLAEGFGD